jgi:hypothetical protein
MELKLPNFCLRVGHPLVSKSAQGCGTLLKILYRSYMYISGIENKKCFQNWCKIENNIFRWEKNWGVENLLGKKKKILDPV